MTGSQRPAKPHGLLKWGFDLPILLYRARLGWLLGHRFLLLTHQVRKSGRIRHTVLEVVRYDPATQESAVLSAYGERADWYQNIVAHPALEVQTGGHHYVPLQRLLDTEERLEALRTYQRRYRRAFQTVIRLLGYPYDGTEAGLRALAESVVVVAFRPQTLQNASAADPAAAGATNGVVPPS
jgi:deazaflavin-dependent oxidoreductase (nitroreductase family)